MKTRTNADYSTLISVALKEAFRVSLQLSESEQFIMSRGNYASILKLVPARKQLFEKKKEKKSNH